MKLKQIEDMNISPLSRIEMEIEFDGIKDSLIDAPPTVDKRLGYYSRLQEDSKRGSILHYYTSVCNGDPNSIEEGIYIAMLSNIEVWDK